MEKDLGTFFESYNRILMDSEIVLKSSKGFCCKDCDYYTSRSSQYNRHLMTAKHIRIQNELQKGSESSVPIYKCNCGNIYKYRQGLVKHKKKCIEKPIENTIVPMDITNPTLIMELIKQNKDIQNLLIEQQKQSIESQKNQTKLVEKVIELSKEPKIVNNGNMTQNNNQKQFNLQFFLNDTCKDAITIQEFIDNIRISLEDLESVGTNGYVKGISDIVLKQLNTLDITKRPIHCTDLKREVIYLKEEDAWNKDDKENSKLKNVIRIVEDKNWRKIPEWQQENPDVVVLDSPEYIMRDKILRNVCGNENPERLREKIVKVIAKETVVDKETVPCENPNALIG